MYMPTSHCSTKASLAHSAKSLNKFNEKSVLGNGTMPGHMPHFVGHYQLLACGIQRIDVVLKILCCTVVLK